MSRMGKQLGFFLWLAPLFFVTTALATTNVQREPPRTVQDDAGFFSAAAKAKANADITEIKRRFGKDLLIETLSTTKRPADLDAKDKKAVAQFFNTWAAQRFKNQKVNGIYVVILQKPAVLRVVVGNKTRDSGLFTTANREELTTIFKSKLKTEKDQALLEATGYVKSVMTRNAPATTPTAKPKSAQQSSPAAPARINWLGWICVGLVVVAVIWMVVGLFRAFSGGGAYGSDMVVGGSPSSGSSGWGSFFPALAGGLFGAAAGMWVYNSFFSGQNQTTSHSAPSAAAHESPAPTSQADDGDDVAVSGGEYDADRQRWDGNDDDDDDGTWDDGGGDDWGGGTDDDWN